MSTLTIFDALNQYSTTFSNIFTSLSDKETTDLNQYLPELDQCEVNLSNAIDECMFIYILSLYLFFFFLLVLIFIKIKYRKDC